LLSLTQQSYTNFEVIIVEDGSSLSSKEVVVAFEQQLNLRYFFKKNEGQGFARNYGFEQAKGDYFIVLDSDVIVPPDYLKNVWNFLQRFPDTDAFGGPDAAHISFSPMQKAINYAMTSTLVTGGIRGKKKRIGGDYQLRSYNMGVSRKVWEQTGGFKKRDMGEDIEWSIRIKNAEFNIQLIPDAFVYHKRRATLRQFAKQIFSFGRTRILLEDYQKGALKAVHWLPALFLLFVVATLVLWLLYVPLASWMTLILCLWSIAILIDATLQNKSLYIGVLSVFASLTQLLSYGSGFLYQWFTRKKQ